MYEVVGSRHNESYDVTKMRKNNLVQEICSGRNSRIMNENRGSLRKTV